MTSVRAADGIPLNPPPAGVDAPAAAADDDDDDDDDKEEEDDEVVPVALLARSESKNDFVGAANVDQPCTASTAPYEEADGTTGGCCAGAGD